MTEHPLSRLRASNIGAFSDVDVALGPGLNVVVGENGAGKSHLLKLAYCLVSVLHERGNLAPPQPSRSVLNVALASKLVGVFRPETLGRLANRRQGRTRSKVEASFSGLEHPLAFSFSSTARTEVQTTSTPDTWIEATPAFLPTRELLSLYPGLEALYRERVLEMDETWRDTAVLLGKPLRRGPRDALVSSIVDPLEDVLGGAAIERGGRFYLKQPGIGELEMHLVAEGSRKLAMLARLVVSGTLTTSGYLFWDEPEANLNPKALGAVAASMVALARAGVQVFVATHSLFLLRELDLVMSSASNADVAVDSCYIGLHRTPDGVRADVGASSDEIGDITALDAELQQAERDLALSAETVASA